MEYTIKDLPLEQQPDVRCVKYGPDNLSDAELLAVILRSGSKGVKAIDLAMCLLKRADGSGLVGLHRLRMNDMLQIKGMGRVKAIQIQCLCELAKRMAMAKALPNICLQDPYSIAEYYMERLRHMKQEVVLIAMFNANNELIGDKTLTKGTVNASLASPRDLFIEALKAEAVNIVLLHNHPSGNAQPSRDDKLLTKRVVECGNLIGIKVIDHIIIGDKKYFSFCQEKLI